MRPEELAKKEGTVPAPRLSPFDLKVGQRVDGWVKEVSADGLWVSLSYLTTGSK
jgi:hypothetical protein